MSTPEDEQRYSLYRLCTCSECEGSGKLPRMQYERHPNDPEDVVPVGRRMERCPECRGEGRVRDEVASRDSPEAVGLALVTLAREGEWEGCAFGLLDRTPECETCGGSGNWTGQSGDDEHTQEGGCYACKGSGVKPTGTWLLKPWLPSARNVTDAARTLARSKKPAAPPEDPRLEKPVRCQ